MKKNYFHLLGAVFSKTSLTGRQQYPCEKKNVKTVNKGKNHRERFRKPGKG